MDADTRRTKSHGYRLWPEHTRHLQKAIAMGGKTAHKFWRAERNSTPTRQSGFMRNQFIVGISCFLIYAGCGSQVSVYGQKITASSHSIDVTVNGQRFYGLYAEYSEAGDGVKNEERSAIVLVPWNNRPHGFSVSTAKGGMTVVRVKDEVFQFKGRRVCRVNAEGSLLTLFAGEIPEDAYHDDGTLKKVVRDIISNAEADRTASGGR